MRLFAAVACLLLWAGAPGAAGAHGIQSQVDHRKAVVVTLEYADGTPFAGEPYEVRAAGSQSALVTGETDPRGRVAFLPSGEGPWRVQARSPGGHGATVTVPAGEAAEGEDAPREASADAPEATPAAAKGTDVPDTAHHGEGGGRDGLSRAVLGLGIILAAFGAWALWRCRRRTV